jgi:hypothetical protein
VRCERGYGEVVGHPGQLLGFRPQAPLNVGVPGTGAGLGARGMPGPAEEPIGTVVFSAAGGRVGALAVTKAAALAAMAAGDGSLTEADRTEILDAALRALGAQE